MGNGERSLPLGVWGWSPSPTCGAAQTAPPSAVGGWADAGIFLPALWRVGSTGGAGILAPPPLHFTETSRVEIAESYEELTL